MTHIPDETETRRLMDQTGMARLQAIRHLQARDTIRRRILRPVYGKRESTI